MMYYESSETQARPPASHVRRPHPVTTALRAVEAERSSALEIGHLQSNFWRLRPRPYR